MLLLVLAATVAGVLTTVAGMGGGTFLVLATSAVTGSPMMGLAASSTALLVGNVHRAWLFRQAIDRPMAKGLILGALPAAALAGALTAQLPEDLVRLAIGVAALAAVIAIARGLAFQPPAGANTVAGATVGAVSATSGGGGLLAGPYLLASGLTGARYIGTGAAMAVAVHIGRFVGYTSGGATRRDTLLLGAGLAVGVTLGNLIGRRLRPHLPQRARRPLELTTAGTLATLAVASAL